MMTTTNNKPSTLDLLVRKHTAFRSWTDLMASMAGGYVPTVNPTQAELASAIEAAGLQVFKVGKWN